MIANVWYRFTAFLRYLFTNDPVIGYLDSVAVAWNAHLEEAKKTYRQQIAYYESNALRLRQELDDKNAEIFRLQERLINFHAPQTVTVDFPNFDLENGTVSRSSGWDAQRNRLEEINSRQRREKVLKDIAEREAEVEEVLNSHTVNQALESVVVRETNSGQETL